MHNRFTAICLQFFTVAFAVACAGEMSIEDRSETTELTAAGELELIGNAEYDFSGSVSLRNAPSQIISSYSVVQRTTRNNSFAGAVVTFRKSTDAGTVRKAIGGFGQGTIVTRGLGLYNAVSTLSYTPAKLTLGTYYVYFNFKTRGDDSVTLIYRMTVMP